MAICVVYVFSAISIKIPMTYFTETEKINPKVNMEAQKTSNSQSNPEQKSNAGDSTIPDFKLCCRAIAIKTAWYWHKNRHEY
jgi:hypothetical protein